MRQRTLLLSGHRTLRHWGESNLLQPSKLQPRRVLGQCTVCSDDARECGQPNAAGQSWICAADTNGTCAYCCAPGTYHSGTGPQCCFNPGSAVAYCQPPYQCGSSVCLGPGNQDLDGCIDQNTNTCSCPAGGSPNPCFCCGNPYCASDPACEALG